MFVLIRDGVWFCDVCVGDGFEVFVYDVVVIFFIVCVLLSDDGVFDWWCVGDMFDLFVVGGVGVSVLKGFKLEIGSATNDISEGWARAFEGDGDVMLWM